MRADPIEWSHSGQREIPTQRTGVSPATPVRDTIRAAPGTATNPPNPLPSPRNSQLGAERNRNIADRGGPSIVADLELVPVSTGFTNGATRFLTPSADQPISRSVRRMREVDHMVTVRRRKHPAAPLPFRQPGRGVVSGRQTHCAGAEPSRHRSPPGRCFIRLSRPCQRPEYCFHQTRSPAHRRQVLAQRDGDGHGGLHRVPVQALEVAYLVEDDGTPPRGIRWGIPVASRRAISRALS